MTTIEKILLSLQNNSDEKKTRITNSYQEKSVWLRNEFDVIRKLIKQNPRDKLTATESAEPEKQVIAEAAAPSSSAPREGSNDGKKRRSPETVNEEKLSPLQKRASVDVEEILAQAGLPSDLNKLTKPQLMSELEKRGVDSYNNKTLKPVLVDALRYNVVSEYHTRNRQVEPEVSEIDEVATDANSSPSKPAQAPAQACTEPEESTNMVIATPSKPSGASVPASARKISNISDIRSMVHDNLSASQTLASEKAAGAEGDAEHQKKLRVESEFRNRYSSMTARKSMAASDVAAAAVVEVVQAKTTEQPLVVQESAVPAPVVAAAPVTDNTAHPKDSLCSTDSIWMEVSSPVRADNETTAEAVAPAPIPCSLQLPEPAESASPQAVSPVETGDGPSRGRTESDASFVSCVSTGSNVPKSTAAPSKPATAAPVKQGAKMTAFGSDAKSSTGPVKSVVPSIQKVKLVPKTAEDQRAMLLAKKAAVPSQGDSSKGPAAAKPSFSTSTSAPAVSQSIPATKPAPVASAVQPAAVTVPAVAAPIAAPAVVAPVAQISSALVASTPAAVTASAPGAALSQKKSIFGTMFGSSKKPTTTGAALSVAPTTAAEVKKPVTAASAPPAMVDAIIKSAKADAAAAPAPLSAPAPVVVVAPAVAAPVAAPATAVKAEAAVSKMQTPPEVKEPVSLNSSGKGVALKDALSSKSLISSIVNNYNNALKSGNNAVHGGNSSGPLNVAPAASAPVLRDITATTNAPTSSVKVAPVPAPAAAPAPVAQAPTPATPSAKAAAPAPTPSAPAGGIKEYIIEDRDSSGESGTDGEGEESEEAKKKKLNIPDWARGPMLKEALERQYGLTGQTPVDPDLIFQEVTTCNLEEIFGIKEGINRKYGARSSSAHWDADQMTLVEKRSYRKHMGYDRALQQQQQATK